MEGAVESLQSLRYNNNNSVLSLSVLDQILLPNEKQYVDIPDVEMAWKVIRSMQIRGAPLIAIVACLGLAVDVSTNPTVKSELESVAEDSEAVLSLIKKKTDYLRTSRPTAVNLFNALDELTLLVEEAARGSEGRVSDRVVQCIVSYAEGMLEKDVSDNMAIGRHGADHILRNFSGEKTGENIRMMTICNTGSLATAGFGTALGVARELQRRGRLESITALETRPYNQGSRLTAFEIVEEGMPGGRLICDSMAAALMQTEGADVCVVGADRVCANGDTANKIGTYQLAIVAAAHDVPFYVASPFTTLDTKLLCGSQIEIEERPGEELLKTSKAPEKIGCWNPAFDVTPGRLIRGIITEKGVIERGGDGTFDIPGFIQQHSGETPSNDIEVVSTISTPHTYVEQSVKTLPHYLEKHAPEAMEALGTESFVDLDCEEVGDGNLNLVFIVTNSLNGKKVVVKQALPYVRCVGESWPLTVDRAYFEYEALSIEKSCCPQFVPDLYHFSKTNALMVMEYIAPPNCILRKGLIQGIKYPTMAQDVGVFCANVLFKTSGFMLSATELRKNVEFWSKNREMCALTEQVIFTEPYIEATNNRWTSPQLDPDKKTLENDVALKISAAKLKNKFVCQTDALLHADLHTGSILCSPSPHQTFVIDPEFAYYGPMGFDIGAFVANLLLAYVSQGGRGHGVEYGDWILEQVVVFWKMLREEFVRLWNDPEEHVGDRFQRDLLGDEEVLPLVQQHFMDNLLVESLGFAGMKMVRRVVGIAHVEDLDSIEDPDVRAKCERHGLEIAKELIKNAANYSTIESVVDLARNLG